MKVIRKATLPKHQRKYEFDKLRPGDAFDVASRNSCYTMFCRWRIANERHDIVLKYAGVSPDDASLHRFYFLKK